jgi:hypothetical protein
MHSGCFLRPTFWFEKGGSLLEKNGCWSYSRSQINVEKHPSIQALVPQEVHFVHTALVCFKKKLNQLFICLNFIQIQIPF